MNSKLCMCNAVYIDGKTFEGGVVGIEPMPIFREEMRQDNLIGAYEEVTIEVKMKKKAIRKMIRQIERAIKGSNNWRKIHGLPMNRRGGAK